MKRRLAMLFMLGCLFVLPSCTSWYTSIERAADGTFIMTRNLHTGLFQGGPQAQVWIGRYAPATKTMTITRKSEKGI